MVHPSCPFVLTGRLNTELRKNIAQKWERLRDIQPAFWPHCNVEKRLNLAKSAKYPLKLLKWDFSNESKPLKYTNLKS